MFFNADPIFVRKFLILDSKSVANFGPWSCKYGTAWSLIPKKTADPDPMVSDAWSQGFDSISHPFDNRSHIPRYDPAQPAVVAHCTVIGSVSWLLMGQFTELCIERLGRFNWSLRLSIFLFCPTHKVLHKKNDFASSGVHALVQLENTTRRVSRRVWQKPWDRSLVNGSLV